MIGLSTRAIVRRQAEIEIGDSDSSDPDSVTVRGWAAIVLGVLGIVAGLGIIAKFVL
ncbi:hypothetical protein D3C71_2036480 [compost metagenome]